MESLWDHKIIVSSDNDDIIKTIKAINNTLSGARSFAFKAIDAKIDYTTLTNFFLDNLNIIENFGSMVLMNDNFYAFTYKPELRNLTLEELESRKENLRFKYLQVDHMSKCVP